MSRARAQHALVLALSLALMPGVAHADDPASRDRVSFGGDAIVAPGEVVASVAAFGGDAIVGGRVEGDVVAFGGDVELAPSAEVLGSVTSVGGQVHAAPGAVWSAEGFTDALVMESDAPRAGLGAFVEDVGRQVVAHGLLFLLALLLMGVAPERLGAMQVTIVRDPARTALHGVAGYVASGLLIVALAITLIGIPAAIALGLVLPLATYVGLAASATVIGAALPVEWLRGEPVRQLAAGVLVLFVASLVPYLGTLTVVAAACLGTGALVRTRFRTTPPGELGAGAPLPVGPYRTHAA